MEKLVIRVIEDKTIDLEELTKISNEYIGARISINVFGRNLPFTEIQERLAKKMAEVDYLTGADPYQFSISLITMLYERSQRRRNPPS